MEQPKEEILDYIKTNRLFIFFKLNKIFSLIADLFNQIYLVDLSGFKIDFTG